MSAVGGQVATGQGLLQPDLDAQPAAHRRRSVRSGKVRLPGRQHHVTVSELGVERVAVAHSDPHRLDLIREIEQQYPPDENDAARRIVSTGTSEYVHEITDEMLAASSRGPHHPMRRPHTLA